MTKVECNNLLNDLLNEEIEKYKGNENKLLNLHIKDRHAFNLFNEGDYEYIQISDVYLFLLDYLKDNSYISQTTDPVNGYSYYNKNMIENKRILRSFIIECIGRKIYDYGFYNREDDALDLKVIDDLFAYFALAVYNHILGNSFDSKNYKYRIEIETTVDDINYTSASESSYNKIRFKVADNIITEYIALERGKFNPNYTIRINKFEFGSDKDIHDLSLGNLIYGIRIPKKILIKSIYNIIDDTFSLVEFDSLIQRNKDEL